MEIVREEGKKSIKRIVVSYNLGAIVAAGYSVNSKQANLVCI